MTELLGFRAGADEHKVQWLSASGDDGSRRCSAKCLERRGAARSRRISTAIASGGGFSAKFFDRLGLEDGAKIPAAMAPAVARGLQKTIEETCSTLAGAGENLCLAGGLFYNALLVEFLERRGRWKNVFVQAAAGNAGTALGAVYHVWHHDAAEHGTASDSGSLLLGPSYGAEEIKQVLENCKLRFSVSALDR